MLEILDLQAGVARTRPPCVADFFAIMKGEYHIKPSRRD